MDVDIFIFIKLLVNAESICPTADIGHRRLAGFLHHIAEIARKLKLSAAVNNSNLDIENFAADRGPCKAAYKTYFIFIAVLFWFKLLCTEIRLEHACSEAQALALAVCNCNCSFAAYRSYLPFKSSDAGFSCIKAYNLANCVVAYFQLGRF